MQLVLTMPAGVYWLKDLDKGKSRPLTGGAPRVRERSREKEPRPGKGIRCAFCLAKVTRVSEQIEVWGHHRHTFANPSGIIFEIGCFRLAPGCLYFGAPSTEFTWFKDHSWQIAGCKACQSHLGWLFRHTSGSRQFHGLILNRLAFS